MNKFIIIAIIGLLIFFIYRRHTHQAPQIQFDMPISIQKMDQQLHEIKEVSDNKPSFIQVPPTQEEIKAIHNLQSLFSKKFQLDLDPNWVYQYVRDSPSSRISTIEIARTLFNSQAPVMSKLLLGQYICNNSMSNAEIKSTY